MSGWVGGWMDVCCVVTEASRYASFFRVPSNPEDSAGSPSVSDLLVCDHHPAELSYRHGYLQAQVH